MLLNKVYVLYFVSGIRHTDNNIQAGPKKCVELDVLLICINSDLTRYIEFITLCNSKIILLIMSKQWLHHRNQEVKYV